MTTPFDTERLDEECERVADEIQFAQVFPSELIYNHEVRAVLLGKQRPDGWNSGPWLIFAKAVYERCRRPKARLA